ncbi:MAG TPA: hypothetical protein VN193_04035 [Candidatus Angelobacter sp.]|jgi:hypothetical protein|nr:hypothetical protein [Candidatus Angelobacter sp.]
MDTLVWTIARGEHSAQVGEDGEMDGDAELVALLRERLAEPITVYRHGTVEGDGAIEMQPGDRRYVVARIRTLCSEDAGFEIVGCDWR